MFQNPKLNNKNLLASIKLHEKVITLLTLEQRESINATIGGFAKQKIEKMAIGLRG